MRKPVAKALILSLKIVLAAVLLAWVLSKVSWNDFVLDADGRTRVAVVDAAVVGDEARLTLPDGETITRPTASLTAVETAEAEGAARYVRPGFFSAIRGLRVGLFAAAAAAFLANMIVGAFRWRRLVAVQGSAIPAREALRLTWLGAFFNCIVLGTTGGDLVKAYYLARSVPGKTRCLVTVVADRVIGLTGLALLSALMLAAVWIGGRGRVDVGQLSRAAGVIAVVGVALAATALFVFSGPIRRRLGVQKLYERLPLSRQIAAAGDALDAYRRRPGAIGVAMAQTFVIHLLFVGGIGLIGASLGLAIPWYAYLIFIPLIYIIAAAPVVPGGVGLAESLYAAFFAAWAGESEILALALLARLTPMFWSLPGALIAATTPRPTSVERAEPPA